MASSCDCGCALVEDMRRRSAADWAAPVSEQHLKMAYYVPGEPTAPWCIVGSPSVLHDARNTPTWPLDLLYERSEVAQFPGSSPGSPSYSPSEPLSLPRDAPTWPVDLLYEIPETAYYVPDSEPVTPYSPTGLQEFVALGE
jgi:hypothetical protein